MKGQGSSSGKGCRGARAEAEAGAGPVEAAEVEGTIMRTNDT